MANNSDLFRCESLKIVEVKFDEKVSMFMQCEKAENLLDLYLINDPFLGIEDKHWLEKHLEECSRCQQEYNKSLQAINLIKQHWHISEDTKALIDKVNQRKQQQAQETARTIKFPKITKRIASIAAVIIVCIGIGYLFFVDNNARRDSVAEQILTTTKEINPVVTITENGVTVSAVDPITTGSEIRKLLINGKHRLVVNRDTRLSINPLVADEKLGCIINLTSGQILAEVQHDRNPFEVHAPHGKAIITGTVFDVNVTDDETTLVVSEGSVRFESEFGDVDVLAGHKSQLRAQTKPSTPLSCNANQLIDWASGSNNPIHNQIEDIPFDMTDLVNESLASILYLSVSQPIDLESLDYDEFVESKREWFKTQFPWNFELKEVLNDKGIEIDYPELLIKTGDIWQIVYPERAYRIIPVIDPNSVLIVAKEYELDKAVYTQIVVSTSKYHTIQSNMTSGIAALEEWLADYRRIQSSCINEKNIEALCESSLAIGEYLENTRALLWLSIQNNLLQIPMQYKPMVLDLLELQVSSAYSCKGSAWNIRISRFNECSRRDELFKWSTESIETIKECEVGINKIRLVPDN